MSVAVLVAPALTPADRQALAAGYEALARRLARPARRSYRRESDDLLGIALLTLVQAAEDFDPSRGMKFSVYVAHRIEWALSVALRELAPRGYRKCDRTRGRVPHREPMDCDPAGQDAPACDAVDRVDELESWLKKVPDRKANVVRALDLDGESIDGVALALGLKRSSVFKLHRSGLQCLNDVARFEAQQRDHPR